MSRMRSEGKFVEMWKMGEIISLAEWTLMSPIHGSSATSPHSLLLCRGGGDGICRDELQWLRIHHTAPLYFRQVPNMSSLCYSESGTPLQRPQPSLWEQKTEMTSGLPSPPPLKLQGTSQLLLSLIQDEFLSKEAHGDSLLAPVRAVPHPSLQSGAPFASLEAKCNKTPGCRAAQLTRQLARPCGRPAKKTSFLVMILEKKSILDFYLICDTACSCLCWLEK